MWWKVVVLSSRKQLCESIFTGSTGKQFRLSTSMDFYYVMCLLCMSILLVVWEWFLHNYGHHNVIFNTFPCAYLCAADHHKWIVLYVRNSSLCIFFLRFSVKVIAFIPPKKRFMPFLCFFFDSMSHNHLHSEET